MEKQFRQALYLVPVGFMALGAWLAATNANYDIQVVASVAAIVVPFGILLIWLAIVAMRGYLEAESDPLKELAEYYRRKPGDTAERANISDP